MCVCFVSFMSQTFLTIFFSTHKYTFKGRYVQVFLVESQSVIFFNRDNMARVYAVSFSMDNTSLLTGSDDGIIRVFDFLQQGRDKGKAKVEIVAHKGYVRAAAFLPDGKHFVTGGKDKTLKVFDCASSEQVLNYNLKRIDLIVVGHNTECKQIVVGSLNDDKSMTELSVFNTFDLCSSNDILPLSNPHKKEVLYVAFSPDGSYFGR